MKRLSDPFAASVVVLGALAAAGLVAVALGWRGVAAEVGVADQVGFLVSGGFGGVAIVGFACGVLVIQGRRWAEARRRAEFEAVLGAAAELLATVRRETGGAR
jgi:hypothetical protein